MRTIGKVVVALALFVALGWSGPASAQVVVKIGYVDYKQIVESWPLASQRIKDLEERYQDVQNKLDGLDEAIQRERQELEARSDMFLSKEQEKQKWDELRQKIKTYAETFRDEKSKLEEEKSQTLDEVRRQVKTVVQDVAERNGYSLVLRKQDLVYFVEKYDLTKEVIAELKKKS